MIEHIQNSVALTALFGKDFELSEVDLHEAIVHRDGPSLRLRFDISRVPSISPPRWPAEANTTQVVLLAGHIDKLHISGFATECSGTLRTLVDQSDQLLEFTAPGCSVSCVFSWLRVESISGYVKVSN